jgi:hypothetical protein
MVSEENSLKRYDRESITLNANQRATPNAQNSIVGGSLAPTWHPYCRLLCRASPVTRACLAIITPLLSTMMASTSAATSFLPNPFLPNPVPSSAAPAGDYREPEQRTSLNGSWILDKTHRPNEDWSMKHYLAVMNVDPLAIEAHDKGEIQHDTIHTIYMDPRKLHIVKNSRVNNNVHVVLEFGRLHVEYLPPGNREKSSMATTTPSEFGKKFTIQSTLQTANAAGEKAHITDVRELLVVPYGVDVGDGSRITRTFMRQTLTIVNQLSGQQSTTTRYFLPYSDAAAAAAAAAAAPLPSTPTMMKRSSSMGIPHHPNHAMSSSSIITNTTTTTTDTATMMMLQGLGQPARPVAASSSSSAATTMAAAPPNTTKSFGF